MRVARGQFVIYRDKRSRDFLLTCEAVAGGSDARVVDAAGTVSYDAFRPGDTSRSGINHDARDDHDTFLEFVNVEAVVVDSFLPVRC